MVNTPTGFGSSAAPSGTWPSRPVPTMHPGTRFEDVDLVGYTSQPAPPMGLRSAVQQFMQAAAQNYPNMREGYLQNPQATVSTKIHTLNTLKAQSGESGCGGSQCLGCCGAHAGEGACSAMVPCLSASCSRENGCSAGIPCVSLAYGGDVGVDVDVATVRFRRDFNTGAVSCGAVCCYCGGNCA
jgi:hypothetical protein